MVTFRPILYTLKCYSPTIAMLLHMLKVACVVISLECLHFNLEPICLLKDATDFFPFLHKHR